jgi:hypothetical protein
LRWFFFITIASDSEETTPGVSVSRNLVVPCGDPSRLRTESNLEFSGLLLRFLNQIFFFPRGFVQLWIRKLLFAARGNKISDRRDLRSDVLKFFWSLLLWKQFSGSESVEIVRLCFRKCKQGTWSAICGDPGWWNGFVQEPIRVWAGESLIRQIVW